jgi:pimeloyl-ACP methyl ester carboxylesterase
MRVGSVPALSRLTTAMPVNERMVRSLFRRIGLRQAVDAGSVPDELVTSFTSLLRHTRTMRNEIDAGPRIITMRGMVDSVLLPPDLLGRVVAPAYFLWGAEDPFGGPQQAEEFTSQFPDAELELVPGAGHCVWIDDPDHAAMNARRFLSGQPK